MATTKTGQTPGRRAIKAPAPPTLEFSWGRGAQVKVEPEVAAAEFDRIKRTVGQVTPSDIVEAARPDQAPLHDEFEWDDAAAAEEYRKTQAGYMLRHLVVRQIQNEQPSAPVRYMLKLRPSQDYTPSTPELDAALQPHVYTTVTEVMAHPAMRRHWLRQAAHELEQWIARHQNIEQFVGVAEPVGQLVVRMRAAADENG